MESSLVQLSGGRKISYCLQGLEGPTVIFESGLTCDKAYWKSLQDRLIDDCITLAYDRSGLGDSDPQSTPKSLASITSDLEELITALDLKPPFIFVGHSFGGTLSKHYSHVFKDKIAGVVFVDASDAYYLDKTFEYRTESQKQYWSSIVYRTDFYETESEKQEYKAFNEIIKISKNIPLRSEVPAKILVCDNLSSWFDPEVDDLYSFKESPKNVLEKDNATWIQCHRDWLDEAPAADLIVVENSSHSIHVDNEDIVYENIKNLVLANG